MRVNKPPPRMNMAYERPTIEIIAVEGVVDLSLSNHRLSEKDTDEELFFTLLDILFPFHD